MSYLYYLLFVTMIIYFSFLFWLIIGNSFTSKQKLVSEFPPVSVLVAIRNGAGSLPNLISDLSKQEYSGKLEFILIDDESQDRTGQIIKDATIKDGRFIYATSAKGDSLLHMKKRALDAGIRIAKYERLLFTDVDCRIKPNWVGGMSNYFINENDYIVRHSCVALGDRLLNIFQSIDFLILLIAARGSVKLGYPLACTGQNQAYRKSLYKKVRGFFKICNERQGDDTLFLQICKKSGKASFAYADDLTTHVVSRQEKTWKSFINQRLRWSGDANTMWKVNIGFYFLMLIIFLFHLVLTILLMLSVWSYTYFLLLTKILMLKFFLEFLLYFSGAQQLNSPVRFIGFISWYFINIPYFVFMGIGSFFHKGLNWKGRKLVETTS